MQYEIWNNGKLTTTVKPEGEPCAAEYACDFANAWLDGCVEQWCVVVKAKNAAGELIRDHTFRDQAEWDAFDFDTTGPDLHSVIAAGGRWYEKAASGEDFSIIAKPCQ